MPADPADAGCLSRELQPGEPAIGVSRVQHEDGIIEVVYDRSPQRRNKALQYCRAYYTSGSMYQDDVIVSRSDHIGETCDKPPNIGRCFRYPAARLWHQSQHRLIRKGKHVHSYALRGEVRNPLLDAKSLAGRRVRRIRNQSAYGYVVSVVTQILIRQRQATS